MFKYPVGCNYLSKKYWLYIYQYTEIHNFESKKTNILYVKYNKKLFKGLEVISSSNFELECKLDVGRK